MSAPGSDHPGTVQGFQRLAAQADHMATETAKALIGHVEPMAFACATSAEVQVPGSTARGDYAVNLGLGYHW